MTRAFRWNRWSAASCSPASPPRPSASSSTSPATTNNVNCNTPSVDHDPRNPRCLVTVFTRHAPVGVPPGGQVASVRGAFSLNGGATWSPFALPANLSNPLTRAPYTRATDANVAFDHEGNGYVVYSEHDDTHSSGALVLQKFSLAGASPVQTITNKVLYQWADQDAALAPALAVDGNLPGYRDPQTQALQQDGYVGSVYVAWATDNAGAGNPNVIKLVASGDGGNTFSTQVHVNDGGNAGPDRNAARASSSARAPPTGA